MDQELENKIIEYCKQNDIDFYTDYHDFEYIDEMVGRNETLEQFEEEFFENWMDAELDAISDYMKELSEHFDLDLDEDFDLHEEIKDLVYNYTSIDLPLSDYLGSEIKCNIMLNIDNELNSDFTDWKKVDDDGNFIFNGWVKFYMESNGYTVKDLEDILVMEKEDIEDEFLLEVKIAFDDIRNEHMSTLTFLSRLSVEDFYSMKNKEKGFIYPQKGYLLGYCPWQGSFATDFLPLKKEISVSKDLIFDVQLESPKCDYNIGYTVDETAGLIGSCWKAVEVID